MDIASLPILNAALNSSSFVFLLLGYFFIKRKNVRAHKICMLTVFGLSSLFLTSYLIYHFNHGSQPFPGEGWLRPVYFSILITHTLLASAILPMALVTLYRGLTRKFESHKKIARWTLPIWLYVSITGVLIYLMLYEWFAQSV